MKALKERYGLVVVTGGSGFLGNHLIRALLDEGVRVRSLHGGTRGFLAGLEDLAGRIEVVIGDVRNPRTVRRAFRGADCACHLAGINGTARFYSEPGKVLDVAVRGMLNVADACRAERVSDLIVASSAEVYQTPPSVPTDETTSLSIPDPLNPRYSYGAGKILTEMLALHAEAGLGRSIVVRPHNIYGPGMNKGHVMAQLIARVMTLDRQSPGFRPLRLPVQGDGRESRAFCAIDDCTDALLRVLRSGRDREIYHVGDDRETTVAELVAEIGRSLGRPIKLIPGSRPAGSPPRRCPDIGKLRALGYVPQGSLPDGVDRLVRTLRGALVEAG